MELLRLNGGQSSEQKVRISDEVLFDLIPNCITKSKSASSNNSPIDLFFFFLIS